MPEAQGKICVICGADCAGQPRIKNDKGQYAHKACVARKQAPEPEPLALDDNDGLAMDDLLGDIADAPESPSIRAACPSCGSALAEGAVICMNCGHNTQSGKKLTSKVITPRDPGAATAAAAKAGSVASLPLLWTIGGCIGGAVGASIWAAISYFTNFEIGYIAVLVGFLTGVGVHVASMGRGAGVIAGALAAVIALASIGAGKYASIYFQVQSVFGSDEFTLAPEDIEDCALLTRIADDHVTQRLDQGETIDWPNPGMIASVAAWPDDYPEDVRTATLAALDELSPQQRIDARARIADEYDEEISYRDVDEDWLTDDIAMDTVDRFVAQGKTLDWPDPSLAQAAAQWPDDYPDAIRAQAQTSFDELSPDEILAMKQEQARLANELMNDFSSSMTSTIAGSGFLGSFNLFDILWAFLAVGAAFAVASGEGFSLTD